MESGISKFSRTLRAQITPKVSQNLKNGKLLKNLGIWVKNGKLSKVSHFFWETFLEPKILNERYAARGDGEKGEGKKKGKEFWFSYRRSESYLRVFFIKFAYKTRRAERAKIFVVFFRASEASTLEKVQKEVEILYRLARKKRSPKCTG